MPLRRVPAPCLRCTTADTVEVEVVELENNRNANGSTKSLTGAQPKTGGNQATGRDLKHAAQHQAENAKDQIRSLAEVGKDRVAEKLDHVARALRSVGDNLRDEEQEDLSQYTAAASDGVERVSRYLREHEAIDLADGMERIARRQPLMYLGGAFVAGLALGRFFKSSAPEQTSSEEGYATGGYDVQYGYPEPEESVVTAPTTPIGGGSPTIGGPQTFTPPSGTFRGPGSNNNPTG